MIDSPDDDMPQRDCWCGNEDCWECASASYGDPDENIARLHGESHVIHDLGNGVLVGHRLRYDHEDADATGVKS